MLDNYERRHDVKKVWRREGGEYVLTDEPYTECWDLEKRRSVAEALADSEFISYIALNDGKVVGFISLKKQLYGCRMILDQMQVSAECRRSGLGRRLFGIAKEEAVKAGASELYISACSSEETIAFYRAMGAEITDDPIAEIAESEPFDLQMVCKVR